MDEDKYSIPMPVIGLYITGASLVCLLLLICDIVHVFRCRKLWIPCRFFTLNSFTLTVLAIATKIPVDLTTPMPSPHDQLAKLCGTIFLCIFIGFVFPSVGDMDGLESEVNVASLFIMVVTVVVNICIQIATGLIYLFVVEHIVVLALMLLLLYFLSVSNFKINFHLKEGIELFKEEQKRKNYESIDVTEVLGKFYKFGYINNPQLAKCKGAHYPTVGIFCLILLLILIEAATRALRLHVLNSYQRVSDYKWSMWMVVGIQIFTVMVVGVAITFRCVVLFSHSDPFNFQVWEVPDFKSYMITTSYIKFLKVYSLSSYLSRVFVWRIFQELLHIISYVRFLMEQGWYWTDRVVVCFVSKATKCTSLKEKWGQEVHAYINYALAGDEVFARWLLRKSKENMKTWIQKYSADPSCHLLKDLACDRDHYMQSLSNIKIKDGCGFLVLLALVANVAMPSESRSLVDALDEVFEIIYFVEERRGRKMLVIVRDVWMSRKISNHWFHENFTEPLRQRVNMMNMTSPQELADALEIFGDNLIIGDLSSEDVVIELANKMRAANSMEELYEVMEQLFVGVLTQVRDELPNMLVEYIFESSYKEVEERAKLSLKYLCKLNLRDVKVPWSSLTGVSHRPNSASMEGEDVRTANVAEHVNEEIDDQGNSSTTFQGEISPM